MPIFNVPGRGRVQLPDGYTQEEYALAISKLSGADQYQPQFSLGQKAFAPIARTLQNIGTSLTTELPAMGLAAIGKDEAARQLLGEAKQRYAETERMAPRMYQSYEDVTGPLSGLGFAYERIGEALPYGLAMLLPGGAAAAGARGIAARAGTAATEAALARGLPAAAAESLGAARATQVMQRAGLGGAGLGGYALNAPETFAKVAEETGELRPGVAATAAIGQTLLDLVAPSAFLSKLGMFGKLKAGEEVAKRAGFTEAAKDLAIAAAKTAPKEGLTEAAQEVIGNAAVDFVRGHGDLFSPERIKQYIEAGLSGAVGGGALGAAGRGIQRIGMPVEQPAQPQQAAVTEPQVTQPVADDTLLKYQIPPMGGITPETVTDQALTPQPSSVGYQVPPETFTETPVDQKYFNQFVEDIMGGMAPVEPVQPQDQQQLAENVPALEGPRVQTVPALPAPEPINIPVPPSETLMLGAPQMAQEGPAEFVEPPPMEGPAPLSEEDQRITDEIAELEKQAAELATQKEAVEARERKRKTQGDTFLNALKKAGVSAKDVADIRRTQSDKNLDKAVVSGLLDPWLGEFSSVAVDQADVFDQKMKQNEAVEYLKDRILNYDYVSDTTKAELADLDLKLDEVLTMIREFRSELEANFKAAEAADEQRVIYEQVEQTIPEGEERVAEPGEAARPEREAARAEVAFTPQSYAEQMMDGTLPDTDEAYAYFQENQQEIEQALSDLEDRRAQPMMKATAGQSKTSQTHADNLGGVVVWQDGDLALIRAHALLTGDPVYVVANGSFRSRTDVENYTGNLINAPQKARLVAAKEALEKKDKALHDKSPFIKFDADGVAMSQSISPELAGVIAGWKKLLKIPQGVYVTTMDDIVANRGKFTGPHRTIGSAALSDDLGSMRKMPDGNYYIAFTKDASVTRMLETLAHELGHIHERESFRNADLATQRSIRDEFDKFLNSSKGKSAKDYIESMRARGVGKTTQAGEKTKFEDLTPYWKSFGEWYADQVSRWATTSEKPLTVVERFFKRLADALKSFYAKVRNQKYLPNETFKQYMDKVTASVKDIAPVRVEAKPLGVKDQMALFMRAVNASTEKGVPKLIEDIPNDDWLQGKIDYAIRKGRNDFGVPFMSTVTGYFRQPVEVPLRVLSKLQGERDEQNNVRESSLKYIRENWEEVSKEPPYIEVAYNGEAWVSEGNHRIMVAAEKGLESMPVEIRYFDGGQRRLGPLHPLRIPSLDEAYSLEPSDTEIQYMRRSVEGLTDAGKDLSPQEQQDLFNAVDKIDDTPAEGMKSMDTMIKDTPSFEATKEKLRQYVGDATMNSSKNLMSFLNMRQLSELAKKELPQFAEYYRVLTNMLNDRDAKLTDAAKVLQEWQDWSNKNPRLGKALDEVMLDARMSGIDPTDPIKFQKIKKESFRKNWEMIQGTEGEKLFIKIRDFYKSQLLRKKDIIERRLMTALPDGPVRQANLLGLRKQFEKFLSDGPYFPLNRFGDYFVAYDVRLPSGDVVPYHEMFESQADQRAHLQSIEKDIASGKVKNLKTGVDSKELFSQGVIKSAFLNDIFDAIDKTDVGDLVSTDTKARLKDDIYQAYLSIMPDLSVHKHFIHAKKVSGASMDMKRAFAETVFHSTYHLARLEYGGSLDAIVGDAQKYFNARGGNARGRYLNELKQQHADFSAPQKQNPIWSKISNFAFMFYLTAPASALVNLTQTPIIGMPTLAGKFNVSFTRASSALTGASKDFMSSRTKLLEFDLEGMLRKAGKTFEADALKALESTINRTQTLSLAGIAERPSALYASGIRGAMQSKGLGIFEKVSLGLGYMFNQAELFNRQVTALAAIRLAREINAQEVAAGRVRKYGDGEIIGLARDLVDQIHFEYASETKPRFMRGPIGQVVLQFKNYAQQMTYLLVDTFNKAFLSNKDLELLRLKTLDKGLSEEERADAKRIYNDALMLRKEARKKFTGIMGMTALFAGYEGLPLYWVIEGVMNTLFGDDDEPYDFSLEMKVAMAELFGDNFARAMSRGPMSELLQIDLASRTSLNGIWFRDDATAKDEEEWVKNMVIDLLGPSVGIVVNTGDAIKKINEGHYARGMEAMMPPILKDFFKAYRFSTEGATTLRGDPIVADVGLFGIFAQAVGFTPQDVARSYEAMGEIKGIEKALDMRRSRLLGKLWLAQQAGDYEAFADLGDEIVKFNAANPSEAIDDKTIRRSFAQREKAASRAERGIIVSPKREYLLEKTAYLDEE
ncbi:MAG: PLxRFG domain-containing protein [Polynucleobacter sp.]